MPQYRELTNSELGVELFDHFERKQVVTDCKRKVDGEWTVLADPFIDDWSDSDYSYLVECLKNTLAGGGVVWGAFVDDELKGFASVERRAPSWYGRGALFARCGFRAQSGREEALHLVALRC